MKKVGARRIFLLSAAVTSIFNTAFFAVDLVSSEKLFLALSVTLLCLASLGDAGIFCSNYVLAAQQTKELRKREESGALGPAIIETMYAAGGMLGPLLGGESESICSTIELFPGGFIFRAAGWTGLLLSIGCSGLCLALLSALAFRKEAEVATTTLPDSSLEGEATSDEAPSRVTYLTAVAKPLVFISCVTMVASGMTSTWYLSSLENHLSSTLQVSPTTVSLVYMCPGIIYTTLTPLTGLLLDRGLPKLPLLLISTLSNIAAYLLLGPSPFLPLDPSLAVTVVGLLLQGVGISITTITCLNLMMVTTGANSESGEGIVTSLWVTCELAGNYLGSTLGGVADETWGFRGGTMPMLVIEVTILVILLITATRLLWKG